MVLLTLFFEVGNLIPLEKKLIQSLFEVVNNNMNKCCFIKLYCTNYWAISILHLIIFQIYLTVFLLAILIIFLIKELHYVMANWELALLWEKHHVTPLKKQLFNEIFLQPDFYFLFCNVYRHRII